MAGTNYQKLKIYSLGLQDFTRLYQIPMPFLRYEAPDADKPQLLGPRISLRLEFIEIHTDPYYMDLIPIIFGCVTYESLFAKIGMSNNKITKLQLVIKHFKAVIKIKINVGSNAKTYIQQVSGHKRKVRRNI
ncbi:unnamed protein product [marine sediment metagenome]|uniref:Uncharacterized protein n=1 Tax=marine sediment metagenome TaxID=412755 RepID=X0W145_9ZZZZ